MSRSLVVLIGFMLLPGIALTAMADSDTNDYGMAFASWVPGPGYLPVLLIGVEMAPAYQDPGAEYWHTITNNVTDSWSVHLDRGFDEISLGGGSPLAAYGIDFFYNAGVAFYLTIPQASGTTDLVRAGSGLAITITDIDSSPIFFLTVDEDPGTGWLPGNPDEPAEPAPEDIIADALQKLPCLDEERAWQLFDMFGARPFTRALLIVDTCDMFVESLFGYSVKVDTTNEGVIKAEIISLATDEVPGGLPIPSYFSLFKILNDGSYSILTSPWDFLTIVQALDGDGLPRPGVFVAEFSEQDLLEDIRGGPGAYVVCPVIGGKVQGYPGIWSAFQIP